jgi:DNA-binding HxlR family transcriptional regulator
MKSYNQFCPIAKAAEVFCERWTALILRDLAGGATRFAQLQRGVPLASPTLLARRLRQLEAEGVIVRRKSPSRRGRTYHLSKAGEELVPIVKALGTWGRRWTRRAAGRMDVHGSASTRKAFRHWLGFSSFAHIRPQRKAVSA